MCELEEALNFIISHATIYYMNVKMCLQMIAVFRVTLEAFDVCLISADSALVDYRVIGLFRRVLWWFCRFSCRAQWMRREIVGELVFATFPFNCINIDNIPVYLVDEPVVMRWCYLR